MESVLSALWDYGAPFLVILTVIVYVHEMGHYLVARWCGVRVEVFSIGFGREIFGWNDHHGTRWKFSLIPLGGYVRMFGDRNAASLPDGQVRALTPDELAVAFHAKRLDQRAAIVSAGPVANFIFGIVMFAGLFMTVGQPFTSPQVSAVQPDSAAAEAGIVPGDRILAINDEEVERFEDIRRIIQIGLGEPIVILIGRGDDEFVLPVQPRVIEQTDSLGNAYRIGQLGIQSEGLEFARHDPVTALWRGTQAAWRQIMVAFKAIGQMIGGIRDTKEIGGPLRIAWLSGEVAQGGTIIVLKFMAILSIHLGLINLFPVPLLDGGHLMFYAAEWIRGKPLGERAQEYGFRIGLALVMLLFVFATWNDLMHLRVVQFFKGLVT